MSLSVTAYLITTSKTVKQAMKQMSTIGEKELFVVDTKEVLLGALSDGDIRKWIVREGNNLDKTIDGLYNTNPKFVGEDFDLEKVKELMVTFKIESVPVLDAQKKVVRVLIWDEVFGGKVEKHREQMNVPVVIMAGGKGSRLDPFTKVLPKPLIPIGDKPIIEMIMDQFTPYGIRNFYICVHHRSKMIKAYFEEFQGKYAIEYVEEKEPLGTVGSLKFLDGRLKDPFIVTNCDVIIHSDYAEMVKFHASHKNDLTLVVSCRHYVIPYGVCTTSDSGELKAITEKPEYDLLVNTGMYVMNNSLLGLIPSGESFSILDLIEAARRKGLRVGVFPIPEKAWVDVGQWEEYYKAVRQLNEMNPHES